MAGGSGERFWPFSRKLFPKQLLPLTSDKPMLAESLDKIAPIIPLQDCYIVTNILLKDSILKNIPQINERNVLCEPLGKNTSACLGFAAAVLKKKYGDCVIAVLTADHLIKDEDKYIKNIFVALEVAERENVILTLGIPPNRPETGYGYIQIERWMEKTDKGWLGSVKSFHEKPDLETAKKYLESGEFFWNSGMFFYKNSTMLAAFEKFMPKLYQGILQINKAWDTENESSVLKDEFEKFESISIDNGIMEKYMPIKMVKADFYWDDIGSWTSLERTGKTDENNNIFIGNIISIDSSNNIAFTDLKKSKSKVPLIGLVGVENSVVVISDDCVLVCSKDKVQDVKKIVQKLKKDNKTEYL